MTFFYNNLHVVAGVGFGKDNNRTMYRAVSRNNILATTGAGIADDHMPEGNSHDYNLYYNPLGAAGHYSIKGEAEEHL